jgi:hypothetical protein
LQDCEHELKKQTKGTSNYTAWESSVNQIKQTLESIEAGLQIVTPNNIEFSANYDDRKAVICYFEDKRFADIVEAKTAQGLNIEIEENKKIDHKQNVSSKLEQHLLNLKTRRSLAITEDKNQAIADTIDVWFADFEKNLK